MFTALHTAPELMEAAVTESTSPPSFTSATGVARPANWLEKAVSFTFAPRPAVSEKPDPPHWMPVSSPSAFPYITQAGNAGAGNGARACISTKNRLLIDYHSFRSLFFYI